MKTTKFQVIEGGLSEQSEDFSFAREDRIFREADRYLREENMELEGATVTDTRLMGVMVMHLSWRLKEPSGEQFDQFFYFDAVWYGFDRFDCLIDGSDQEIEDLTNSFSGGLGGKEVPVTLDESVYLFHKYQNFNIAHDIADPDGELAFGFLGDMPVHLTEEGVRALWRKVCKAPASPYECVNYFLMRWCDQDLEGMLYLAGGALAEGGEEAVRALIPDRQPLLTLYRNEIESGQSRFFGASSRAEETFHCRFFGGSDGDEEFLLFHADITVQDRRVTSFSLGQTMKLTDQEAYLQFSHEESVTVFRFYGDPDAFDRHATELTRRAMIIDEENGTLFMIYRTDNSHVDRKEYRIYDDLRCCYFLTDGGQLVCCAARERDRAVMEYDLMHSELGKYLEMTGRYQFGEPVMNLFIESGLSDFEQFVQEYTEE